MNKRSIAAVAVAVVLVAGIAAVYGARYADTEVEVKIGATVSEAKVCEEHNLTVDALKDGKTEFWAKAEGHNYKITLTEEQVSDILDGTTVMVNAGDDGADEAMKVSIAVKETKKKKSGW